MSVRSGGENAGANGKRVPAFTWKVEPALGSWFDRWRVYVYRGNDLYMYDNSYFGRERAVAKAQRFADSYARREEAIARQTVTGAATPQRRDASGPQVQSERTSNE